VKGHPENEDVSLWMMTLDTGKIEILAEFFGGQGMINVPCWSPHGRRITSVTYQAIPRSGATRRVNRGDRATVAATAPSS
jgi:hypothetical protein